MSNFIRPSLSQLFSRAQAIINSNLPGADALLQKAVLRIIALVIAEMINGNYGYLSFISDQPFATLCNDESLKTLAAIRGITPIAAEKASGTAPVTGTDGSEILIGEQLQRSDGLFYNVTADTTISGGTADVPIEANTAGTAGNAEIGTVLTFVSPPAGVNAQSTLTSAITGGTDEETTEELRARYLDFIRKPPQGGSDNDYEIWGMEVAGVTKVFVSPREYGAGTVVIRFLVKVDDEHPDGIPLPADVTRMQNYIDTKRPVTAKNVVAVAPVAAPLDFEIELLVNDNTDIEAAVVKELKAMLFRDAIPGGTIYRSRIIEAISLAAGEYACNLIEPAADVTNVITEISTFGSVIFD